MRRKAIAASPGAAALGPELAPLLLITRLTAPRPRPGLVRRPRLLARLDAALAAPLAIVSAPAGFGKTTLLVDWIASLAQVRQGAGPHSSRRGDPDAARHRPPLAAWLSLDAGDSDPAMFVRYLVGALRVAGARVGAGSLALLGGGQPASPAAALVPLLNDLAALPGDTLLVLDDYHVLAGPAVAEALTLLTDRLPPRVHLVLAGRGEPPLALGRLRTRGQLVELGVGDLRFTAAEARALLGGRRNPGLPDDELALLAERTEGWAVGLQLAAVALRGRPDPAAFVAGFAGSNRYLFDYLAEEVFGQQPPERRDFLLRTSVLERLSGTLCDELLGLPPGAGAAALDRLERDGLFLLPLDDERRWYRYHQLFAETLRERLRGAAGPDEVAGLYRRAAAADPAFAVAYLLAAGHWDEAADRIEDAGRSLLARGQHETVRRWIEALPDGPWAARPGLCVLLGAAAARSGELLRAEGLLADGAALSEEAGAAPWRAMALSELALLALVRGELARSAELVEAALALPAPREVRASGLLLSVFVHTVVGRREAVAHSAEELFAALRGRPDPQLLAHVLEGAPSLALALFDQLGPLEEVCRAGLRRAGGQVSLARVGAEAGLAHIAWLRGRLDEALAMSERAMGSGERFGTSAYIEPQMASVAGIVAAARGDLEGAARQFARGQRSALPMALYAFARPGQIYRLALVRWQQGRLEEVRAARAALAAPMPGELGPALAGLIGALLAISAGAHDEAEALLRPVAAREAGVGLMAVFGSAHPLLACLELRRGRPAAAAAALAPLLAACARDGTPGRLLLEGPYIAPLLRLAVAHGVYANAAAACLALMGEARGEAPGVVGSPPSGPGLTETLSERELQVLRLLAAGRSNRAIAEEFVVTVGTIKRHVSNLMDKLGVESRLAAVARARELGLV